MPSRARIYVGGLSRRTGSRQLKILFARYGRLREVDLKSDYAFVVSVSQEFEDYRDAEDAMDDMHKRTVDGCRISVERATRPQARGTKEICFNCGKTGHWARECKEEDYRGRCYRCGGKGHEKRECAASRSRSRNKEPAASISVLGTESHSPEHRDEYD